jgi:foldase protein PrsA
VSFRAGRYVAAFTVIAVIASAPAAAADPVTDSIVAAGAVARIGDRFIARSQFDRWFGVAAASNPATADPLAYDPPQFTRCVEIKRATAPKPAKGQPATTGAQFKTQCKREYEGLRDQVLQFLILESWVSQETLERGTGPSDVQLEAAFQKTKNDTFPKESDFRKFLKESGMTIDDARFQVAFNERYTRLREAAIANIAPVTDKDIASYYKRHKREFFQSQTRDVRVVLTRTRARAYAAYAALRRGRFWKRVTLKYSVDHASRGRGGILRGVSKGSQDRALDAALFRAPKDALHGPVKTQFGYWVFRVFEIHPARQLTLKQASRSIRQQLTAQRQRAADDAFNDDFSAKWRARTTCLDGFLTSHCSNGPLPDPESDDF